MKLLTTLSMLFIFCFSYGQQKMNEKQAIKESHIDFTRQYLYFEISGLIEIDGHVFLNDTCSVPVIYKATIDGVSITKGDSEYAHRTCDVPDCKIIHLVSKAPKFIWPNIPQGIIWQDNTL